MSWMQCDQNLRNLFFPYWDECATTSSQYCYVMSMLCIISIWTLFCLLDSSDQREDDYMGNYMPCSENYNGYCVHGTCEVSYPTQKASCRWVGAQKLYPLNLFKPYIRCFLCCYDVCLCSIGAGLTGATPACHTVDMQ